MSGEDTQLRLGGNPRIGWLWGGIWLVYLTIPLALIGLVLLGLHLPAAFVLLALVLLGWVIGALALRWPEARRIPLPLALAGFAVASNTAGMLAWLKVFRRQRMPTWEPTRRP